MQRKRFYDQEPTVLRAVELLLIFPRELQALIADGISTLAERNFKISVLVKELKTLGTENVLALYKARQRKRAYDQVPAVHKAINELMILTPVDRVFLSRKVLGLMHHLQDYLIACKEHGSSPSPVTIRETVAIYVQHGSPETTRHLQSVQAVLISEGSQLRPVERRPATSPLNGMEVIQDEAVGLRLRKKENLTDGDDE